MPAGAVFIIAGLVFPAPHTGYLLMSSYHDLAHKYGEGLLTMLKCSH